MATYIVTRVRKVISEDGSHLHIAGVCAGERYYTREQVIDSIARGDTWRTDAGGYSAEIRLAPRCPRYLCSATPYIQTNPGSSLKDNLENLDPC